MTSKTVDFLLAKGYILEKLTVHVYVDSGLNGSSQVGISGLAGQACSKEAPVDIVKGDLVPHRPVTQDMVRLVN